MQTQRIHPAISEHYILYDTYGIHIELEDLILKDLIPPDIKFKISQYMPYIGL